MITQDFIERAKTFGKADAETQNFRDRCKAAGFSVVFYDGMTREQALSILESRETKQLIKE